MRGVVKFAIWGCVLLGLAAGVWFSAQAYRGRNRQPNYRTAKVAKRTIVLEVESTGEIKPVLSVAIGSFVSGPIEKLYVDFNERVTQGQLLAKIDPRIYDAAVAGAQANLITREADVKRVQAQLQQAINDERRSVALRSESEDFISQTEIDRFHFARMALEAQLAVAEAAVAQAQASLSNAEANLAYTLIRSPVDGIVLDRKIDPGQTLAAQFQTPELFVIAPDMESRMHVFATIDEADIGLIRKAQEHGKPVKFTVDAYPEDTFEGKIQQIRFSSTANQNVVTYPVVVAASNPDMKLMPGMTANLAFQIEERQDVLCVPNAALRFYPQPQQVREQDRHLLDGAAEEEQDDEEQDDDEEMAEAEPQEQADQEAGQDENGANRQAAKRAGGEDEESAADGSADETLSSRRLRKSRRRERHVWVQDVPSSGTAAQSLRAVEVTVGLSDNRYTEVLDGNVREGLELVTGVRTGP
jgi:HlyD family secretion protein